MFDLEDDFEDLSYAATPEEADRESARKCLARMFPELDEEEFIELEEGRLMRHTLNRVLDTMLHLTGPSFSMNRTFSNEVFYRAKEEAYDLEQWLDTPDDTPMPETLKYKAPEEESDEDEEVVKTKDSRPSPGPYQRRARGIQPTSKYQRAIGIVRDNLTNGVTRSETVAQMVRDLELSKAVAESYYSKVKNEIETAS